MTPRLLPLASVAFAALTIGAQRAHASTTLGSPDTSAAPDAFACAACPVGVDMGFQQFALRGATVEAPEEGVLVSASAYAKRIGGGEQPRIAVLRPAEDDVTKVTVVDSAPVPVTSPDGETADVDGLHLAVQSGDSIGFIVPTGQVDLGVGTRARPDGAIQSFALPCEPCGMDGGTGAELLFNAVVEPDVDADGLGDESQDPDGGGLGATWEDDWFQDYDEGDQLEADNYDDPAPGARRRLGLLAARRRHASGATLLIWAPRGGRLSAAVTVPADRRTGAGPFVTILTGERRVRHAGRVRLHLDATARGARVLARRRLVRTKVVVSLLPRSGDVKVRMRSAAL
jgi:hypothetical protein